MSSGTNEAHGATAAAAIPVVSQLGQAFAAAIGGMVVNASMPSTDVAAAGLFALFALLGLGAALAAHRHVARTM